MGRVNWRGRCTVDFRFRPCFAGNHIEFKYLSLTRKEKAVSRVLFRPKRWAATTIHLGQSLPTASSDRTRRLPGEQPVSHLDPPCCGESWLGTPPYLVLLRVGFAESRCRHRDWCALTAPFHPYQARCTLASHSVCGPGGLFSVALSLGSPPLEVIQHPALRSPDFPPPTWQWRAIIWPSSSWNTALPGRGRTYASGLRTGLGRMISTIGISQRKIQGHESGHGVCIPTTVARPYAAPCSARAVERGRFVGLQVRARPWRRAVLTGIAWPASQQLSGRLPTELPPGARALIATFVRRNG